MTFWILRSYFGSDNKYLGSQLDALFETRWSLKTGRKPIGKSHEKQAAGKASLNYAYLRPTLNGYVRMWAMICLSVAPVMCMRMENIKRMPYTKPPPEQTIRLCYCSANWLLSIYDIDPNVENQRSPFHSVRNCKFEFFPRHFYAVKAYKCTLYVSVCVFFPSIKLPLRKTNKGGPM